MKYIQKGEEPVEFTDWKALATEEAPLGWDDLGGRPKES